MKKSLQSIYIICFLCILNACSLFKKASAPLPKPSMVFIKGGTFEMGDIFEEGNPDALPSHSVTVHNFYIGKYEITVSQYNSYIKRTGQENFMHDDSLQSGNIPVTKVSWDEALAYCRYFGYRLPTEEEWEYAARSGGKKQRFAGTNNADSLYLYGNADLKNIPAPLPVGFRKPNALDLYDMSGNVYEWIGDYYQIYPQEGEKPTWDNLDTRILRVIRGGSYIAKAPVSRTYWRTGMLHDSRSSDVGFRCASDEL